jgi:hypothetical protein
MNNTNGNSLAFDHIWYGRHFKHFSYPPSIILDISVFEDALKEAIPIKLEELIARASELKEQRDLKLAIIGQKCKHGTFDEYFHTSFVWYEFSEYFVIQKWINYWLQLWYRIYPQSQRKIIYRELNIFSEQEIEQARQAPIESYYEGKLRKVGSRLVGLCPFHQEKTPSFYIFPNNRWHCFGACAEGGDVIKFVMKLKNMTFPDVVRCLL